MVLLLIFTTTLSGWAALPATTNASRAQGIDRPVVNALIEELKMMPSLNEARGPAAGRWNELLLRLRESPDLVRPFIHAMMESGPGTQVNAALAVALLATGQTADHRNVPPVDMAPALFDLAVAVLNVPETRVPALTALGTIGPRAAPALPWLFLLIRDEEPSQDDVRERLAQLLGAIGPGAKDALPWLQRLYGRSSGSVQGAARAAVEKIAGASMVVDSPAPGGMLLLPGYSHVSEQGFDTQVGTITREGGPELRYDIGAMAGDKATQIVESGEPFVWSKVQFLNGQMVRITMQPGGRLIATFIADSANFEVSAIRTPEDLAEVLLTLASYKPSHH